MVKVKSKLDKIFEMNTYDDPWDGCDLPYGIYFDSDEAKEGIKALILGLIGEDEQQFDTTQNGQRTPMVDKIKRNELRTELRQKVKEL